MVDKATKHKLSPHGVKPGEGVHAAGRHIKSAQKLPKKLEAFALRNQDPSKEDLDNLKRLEAIEKDSVTAKCCK